MIVMGTLALTVADSLGRLNALKGLLSLIDCTVSVLVFGLFGPVHWSYVAIAAPACLLGGYAGARMARRLSETHLRGAVITLGLAVSFYLALR